MDAYFSLRQGFAVITALVLIVVPVEIYCDYRISFGNWPLVKLLLVAGLGGSITFSLWAQVEDRRLVLMPGFVAGIGAVSAQAFLLMPSDQCVSLSSKYSTALLFLGAVPGFLLLWGFKTLFRSKRKLG